MMLALLQAAPLVHNGAPVDLLDLKQERDVVLGALRRAGKRMEVCCDFCTTRRLRDLLTDGCRILHYSGHGFSFLDRNGVAQARLAFENGEGGTHSLEVQNLTNLVAAGADGDGAPPLDFAFVSACHSVGGGEAFVAAGVPHVVAVKREAQLQDKAACMFAEAFYHALFKGRTVKAAFEIGREAVANQPNILRAGEESDKFLLLPMDTDHNVPLCRALPEGPLHDVSPVAPAHNLPAFFPLQYVGRQLEQQQLVSAAVAQGKRLLSLVGAAGVGKTSLALAAAHYLYERAAFSGGVFFVSVAGASSAADLSAAVLAALAEAGCAPGTDGFGGADEADATIGGMGSGGIGGGIGGGSSDGTQGAALGLAAVLRRRGPCLLLIDNWEQLQGQAQHSGEGGALVQSLLQRAPELRLLVTSTVPVQELPGVAQRQLLLAPMASPEAAKLFRTLAPRPVTRHEVGCDNPSSLKHELGRLMGLLGGPVLHAGLDHFSLVQDPSLTSPPLKIQWVAPDVSAAATLHRLLSSQPSTIGFELSHPGASGRACVLGCLSLPRMLAAHGALTCLHGNPKAVALAVSLLLEGDGLKARPVGEVATLLAREVEADLSDLPDGCRATLERLNGLLRPGSPTANAGGGATPPAVRPSHCGGGYGGVGASGRGGIGGGAAADDDDDGLDDDGPAPPPADPLGATATASLQMLGVAPVPVARSVAAAPHARASTKLPPTLLLRSAQLAAMCERSDGKEPPWLGSGSFGSVYQVEFQGVKVAIKKFFDSASSSSAFKREAALLHELRHPHVVQLIKVCCKPLCIVTELLACSLHALLHGGGGGAILRATLLRREAVPTICSHIACGMHYLHSLEPPVLHRNLKTQNLLLNEGGRVKIADFGWSRFKELDSGKTFFHGWQWVAPEILGGARFDLPSDVYSFAMVSWEVLTRSLPFTGMNPVQIGLAVREQKLRPELPPDCPQGFGALLRDCWHDEPERRHTFAAAMGKLQAIEAMGEFGGGD